MEVTKEILEDLAARGFEDAQLEQDISEKMNLGLPNFSIIREKEFGEEMMVYKLIIQWQESLLGYGLTTIDATHRMPVDVDQKFVNGINSWQLDKDMEAIDWKKYWNYISNGKAQDGDFKHATDIIDGLAALLLHEAEDVRLAGEQLMYKHWPAEVFAELSQEPERFKRVYEHHYNFDLSSHPLITADLAFLIISERIDNIQSQLADIRFDKVTDINIEQVLYKVLVNGPESFEITGNYNFPGGLVEYNIPGQIINGWYQLNTYSLTVTPYPEITHDTFNGINSADLEVAMQQINWKNDHELFIFHENHEPEFRGNVYDIQEQLYRLSLDFASSEIAELLQLKYLQEVTFFGDHILQTAWDKLDDLPKRTSEFPVKMEIKSAVNLLLGRAVKDNIDHNINNNPDRWLRLDLTKPLPDGSYTMQQIEGFCENDMEDLLKQLPIPNYRFYQVKEGLLHGEPVRIELETGKHIIIIASPTQRNLDLFTSDMRPIPYNFHLDPDWKPSKIQVNNQVLNSRQDIKQPGKPKGANRLKNNKGRGI